MPEKKVIKIVKVNPYPIAATLKGSEATPLPASIIMVNTKGIFADLNEKILHLNSIYEVNFELPKLKAHVLSKCKVIRYIDRSVPDENNKSATRVQRLIEFHFISLDPSHFAKIQDFCKLIKQSPQ